MRDVANESKSGFLRQPTEAEFRHNFIIDLDSGNGGHYRMDQIVPVLFPVLGFLLTLIVSN